ncbi:MAG: HAMP domain-containing histidine kinase [Myxococcota bacterium]|nr:HAMP domain-containing histidine kinase [Deltaproteobacteria bacterium]MDQ3336667.1 HAMP domain-containing histidine kinase [Myxococcota bacterium]
MGITLHEFTSANRGRILERILDILAEHADEVPRDQLAGSLPQIIDELVIALGDGLVAPHDSLRVSPSDAAARQGVFRFQAGCDLEMVVRCFGALCDSITALAEEDGLTFHAAEFRILNQSIDSGIADAVEAFAAQVRHTDDAAARERIGALAHELRNALATVVVGFETLKTGRAGFASKTATVVTRGLDRMQTLISQTLAASKLQADSKLDLTTQGLGSLIREVVEMVPPSDVHIEVNVARDVMIEADRTLMMSAVGNLIQNAVKFTHAGGAVDVRAVINDNDHEAIIEVSDECGGLRVTDPETLFVPFHQHDPSRGGAGLGLAIVRDAVTAHGGTVEVRDEAPKGCLFILRWPLSPRTDVRGAQHTDRLAPTEVSARTNDAASQLRRGAAGRGAS